MAASRKRSAPSTPRKNTGNTFSFGSIHLNSEEQAVISPIGRKKIIAVPSANFSGPAWRMGRRLENSMSFMASTQVRAMEMRRKGRAKRETLAST